MIAVAFAAWAHQRRFGGIWLLLVVSACGPYFPLLPAPAVPTARVTPIYEVEASSPRIELVPVGANPDGTFLVLGEINRKTLLVSWDLRAAKAPVMVESPFKPSSIDVLSQRAVDCSEDYKTVFWDIRTGSEIWTANGIDPSESFGAKCGIGLGGMEVYRTVVRPLLREDNLPPVAVFAGATGRRLRLQDWWPLVFFPDGKKVLVARGGSLECLEMPEGRVVAKIDPFRQARSVAISSDGQRILVITDSDVRVFEARTGSEISRIEGRYSRAYWTPSGQIMVDGPITDGWGSWSLYAPTSSRMLANFKGFSRSELLSDAVGFSPDGKYLLFGSGRELHLVSRRTNRPVARAMIFAKSMWAVVTPQGYFAGADRVFEHLSVRGPHELQAKSMYSMRGTFERPDVVAATLSGGDAEAAAAAAN